ncbi:MAG: S-layer homology domain-containing protein [Firmicutes bacterium]|nr:S-layer homology domain-containing protein [Bacillota bacterium]
MPPGRLRGQDLLGGENGTCGGKLVILVRNQPFFIPVIAAAAFIILILALAIPSLIAPSFFRTAEALVSEPRGQIGSLAFEGLPGRYLIGDQAEGILTLRWSGPDHPSSIRLVFINADQETPLGEVSLSAAESPLAGGDSSGDGGVSSGGAGETPGFENSSFRYRFNTNDWGKVLPGTYYFGLQDGAGRPLAPLIPLIVLPGNIRGRIEPPAFYFLGQRAEGSIRVEWNGNDPAEVTLELWLPRPPGRLLGDLLVVAAPASRPESIGFRLDSSWFGDLHAGTYELRAFSQGKEIGRRSFPALPSAPTVQSSEGIPTLYELGTTVSGTLVVYWNGYLGGSQAGTQGGLPEGQDPPTLRGEVRDRDGTVLTLFPLRQGAGTGRWRFSFNSLGWPRAPDGGFSIRFLSGPALLKEYFAWATPNVSGFPGGPFWDLGGHWAEAAVLRLAGRGILAGFGDGGFRPDYTVTRAEFAKMLVVAAGLTVPLTGPTKPDLSGVKDASAVPSWAFPYVAAARAGGLLTGDSDGSFRPRQALTRAEMATALVRAAGKEKQALAWGGGTLPFKDAAAIPVAARAYVAVAVQEGLLLGMGDGGFGPLLPATRAQAAAALNRLPAR